MDRILSRFYHQPFVTQLLQHPDLIRQFLFAQLPPYKILIGMLIAAIFAVIDTIVADIQRRKQDDAVAVDLFFNDFC
ncbi:hypothetical protein D3C80_2018490 [compost metagenome]